MPPCWHARNRNTFASFRFPAPERGAVCQRQIPSTRWLMRWPNCLSMRLEFWQRGNRGQRARPLRVEPALSPSCCRDWRLGRFAASRPECLCRSTRAASHTAAPVRPEGARVTCLKGGALLPFAGSCCLSRVREAPKVTLFVGKPSTRKDACAGSAAGRVNALARTRSAWLASRRSLCARQCSRAGALFVSPLVARRDNYCAGIHFFEAGSKICLGAFCMSAFVVDTTAVHSESCPLTQLIFCDGTAMFFSDPSRNQSPTLRM